MFRTRIRNAYRNQNVNFAGSYIVSTWGCGTSCLMGVAINTRTGHYTMLPATICCWGSDVDDAFQPVIHRKNSRLILFSGILNEGGTKGAHFYKLEKGKFVHVKTNSTK